MSSRTIRLEQLISLWAALFWLAAAVLQQGDYFRPLPPDASGRVGSTAAYQRSPCPALNALANHGYIPRDGRAVTAQALKAAVMKHFNVDSRYADTLVALAKKPVFDLNDLSAHNVVEHDMSMVHKDAFFGGDPAVTDAALIGDFIGHVGASGVLDPWFFARTQQRRLRECMKRNPECLFSNEFLLSVTLGRQGLLMRVMGGKNEEAVDVAAAKMLLVDERLAPTWIKSSKPISQNDIQDSRVRLFDLLKASGEWLGDGFGTTSAPLRSDADATQCLHVLNKAVVLATCNESIAAQKFLLDEDQRIRVGTGGCLQVEAASNAMGASIVEATCRDDVDTTQQWRYDASGRLRPVQAPDLCLDLIKAASSVKVTTAACSTRTEQRFFTFYANFQPSVSRLASIDAPRFCLGLKASTTPASEVEVSPVVVVPCYPSNENQELTLDDRKRLVFSSDNTQCVDLSDRTVVQTPCSDSSTTWHYDSLGRLRPGSALAKCLQFPGGSLQQVVLADCADVLALKWFILGTKNADIRPSEQYYRPNVFESSGKTGTTAAYSRSPCPALNTLANHGFLPRSGRNLTALQVKQAVIKHFNIDPAYAQVLVGLANRTVFNLDDLSRHNAAEHDMSLVHADAFFGQDPAVTDSTLATELFRHVGSSGTMDILFFARTQARRLKDCQARNPQCDFSNDFLMSVALGRLGLLMRAVGGQNENLVALERVQSFLIDEHFPTNFTKSPTPVTQFDIQETRKRISSLLKSSGAWLVDGFLNSKKSVSIVSDCGRHGLCLAIAGGSTETNASLVVVDCDTTKREQQWRTDDTHRVVSEQSGLCLAAREFGTHSGTTVVQLECDNDASNQRWAYDASGRLRPVHAAHLCLGVDSQSLSVTLWACNATPAQRFVSIYDAFQPNMSHLNNIENPDQCVGVVDASTIDGAAVHVAACNPALLEQQLTMDADGRLVFQHSSQCLTQGSSGIVQAPCGSVTNQQWQYDSLGRLHAAMSPSQCLALSSRPDAMLELADCSDVGTQRWYASDATDPNNRPQNAYYRPNRDESSGRHGTTATYSRSPCPALNALANHGIISRDGRNISRLDLVGAAVATYNIDPEVAERFLSGHDAEYLNLDDLSDAATFETAGSLFHSDAFFTPDPAAIDPELVHDVFARVGSGDRVDLVLLAAAQRRRLDAHPSTKTLSHAKYQKPGLVLSVVSLGGNDVSADSVKQLLVEERIPDGFTKPTVAVTAADSAATVQAIIETGGTNARGQGGVSTAWLSRPFQPVREPIYAISNQGVQCLTVANGTATLARCNATNPSQLITYDDQQRLVVDATATCLDVVDGKLGDGVAVNHVDCTDWPHQKWTYDASGRLHPQHAPKFCLRVGADTKGALAKCSDNREQVFFAAFPNLTMHEKQLVAVAPNDSYGSLSHCLRATTGGVGVDVCHAMEGEQLFSLDDNARLVLQGTSQCVGVTESGRVTATDCRGSLAWVYDSLGRLHVQTAMDQCLMAATDSREAVTLAACGRTAAQQWVVARLTVRLANDSRTDTVPQKVSAATKVRVGPFDVAAMALLAIACLGR